VSPVLGPGAGAGRGAGDVTRGPRVPAAAATAQPRDQRAPMARRSPGRRGGSALHRHRTPPRVRTAESGGEQAPAHWPTCRNRRARARARARRSVSETERGKRRAPDPATAAALPSPEPLPLGPGPGRTLAQKKVPDPAREGALSPGRPRRPAAPWSDCAGFGGLGVRGGGVWRGPRPTGARGGRGLAAEAPPEVGGDWGRGGDH
jgi:hypothetical protein